MDLIDHLVPVSLPWAGAPSIDQAAQSSVLEPCQGGRFHSLFGQSVPGPHHPHSKELFLLSDFKFAFCQSKAVPLVLSLYALIKSPSPVLF